MVFQLYKSLRSNGGQGDLGWRERRSQELVHKDKDCVHTYDLHDWAGLYYDVLYDGPCAATHWHRATYGRFCPTRDGSLSLCAGYRLWAPGPQSALGAIRTAILHWANLWFSIWNLTCGFANSKGLLIAARFMTGLGAAHYQIFF